MKVIFTGPAKRALDHIYEWYKERKVTKKGRLIRAGVIKKALLLKDHPNMGQEEEQLKDLEEGHRYLIEGNYKIIYRIIDQTVYITDIFDSRQDPGKMKG